MFAWKELCSERGKGIGIVKCITMTSTLTMTTEMKVLTCVRRVGMASEGGARKRKEREKGGRSPEGNRRDKLDRSPALRKEGPNEPCTLDRLGVRDDASVSLPGF